MRTLFVCSIGPVQDFIATARKSRDLWYGSLLLSELAKSVAKIINDTYGINSLITPAPSDVNDLETFSEFSAPNKILAVIHECGPGFEETLKNAIDERLKEFWEDAKKEINGEIETDGLAWDQIKDLVEFYWVTIPYKDDDGYKNARETAEALLAARKNTRDFKSLESTGKPKSSLDGFRESVIPATAYPKKDDDPESKSKKIRDLYLNYHAKEGEQLSGVDLLKRLGKGKNEASFPSTSELAAAPFFEGLIDKSKEDEIIPRLKKILTDNEWPENQISENRALVFESRLMEYLPLKEKREEARKEFTKILKEYVGKMRPSPYYALLIADGDNMGKVIDSKNDENAHRELSKLISEFAKKVPKIIKDDYQGTCIYAGGEDILAYLPLHTALDCAAKLEDDFKKSMENQNFTENGKQYQPTLSGGLVIAHHLTPLSEVFKLARTAEKESKKIPGKNALTIILNKRSGAERMVRDNWPTLIKRFQVMIEMTRKGWISKGTAYELQGLALEFPEARQPWLEQAIINEAIHIIENKRQPGTDKALLPEVKCVLVKWLSVMSISELALEMIIAAEFSGAEEMAGSSIKEVLKCKNG